ncbi:MAG: hypothetical protein LBT98_00060, partial [Puniceicoccales bacterium]|nr:hypothetical protein [Puniceicoccales bacterium]
ASALERAGFTNLGKPPSDLPNSESSLLREFASLSAEDQANVLSLCDIPSFYTKEDGSIVPNLSQMKDVIPEDQMFLFEAGMKGASDDSGKVLDAYNMVAPFAANS